MFVASLSQGAAAGSSSLPNTTRDRSSSVLSVSSVKGSSRRPSHSALDPNFAAGSIGLNLTSPLTSPGPSQSQLPQSPPVEELADDPIPPELDERDREFDTLLSDLRGALAPLGERSKVWIPEDQRKGFRIVLVDKVGHGKRSSDERSDTTSDNRACACHSERLHHLRAARTMCPTAHSVPSPRHRRSTRTASSRPYGSGSTPSSSRRCSSCSFDYTSHHYHLPPNQPRRSKSGRPATRQRRRRWTMRWCARSGTDARGWASEASSSLSCSWRVLQHWVGDFAARSFS